MPNIKTKKQNKTGNRITQFKISKLIQLILFIISRLIQLKISKLIKNKLLTKNKIIYKNKKMLKKIKFKNKNLYKSLQKNQNKMKLLKMNR